METRIIGGVMVASYTQNCNLILPEETENYDIRVANVNNSTIDEELGKKVDKKANKDLSTNDFTNQYKGLMDEIIRYDDVQVHDDIKIDIVGLKANKADRIELESVKDKVSMYVVTGEEIATQKWIDNKQVYCKRLAVGALPNAQMMELETGLTDGMEIVEMKGIGRSVGANMVFPLPYVSTVSGDMIQLLMVGNKLQITTGIDRSDINGFVELYYVKN